jgi:hypothetical protein
MKITNWVSYKDIANYKENSFGGLGGFFSEGG